MSSNNFLIRVHRRLLTFWLLSIFIHYLLIKWWFRSLFFLIRYLLFFRLIGPSNEKTLNLMIILLVPEDLPHYLILVAIWNFILPMLPSTADSWVGTLPRFSTIHERPILFVRRLRLNCRLIIFSIPTSSRHLIDNTKALLSELRMVFGRRSTPCASWCLWLLLSLGIIVGGAGWQPGFFEIASKQNRLIFPCLVT
jgi:hypothetical protein